MRNTYARQESLYKSRFGIELPRQTMSDAAGKVADQLTILTTLMKEDMLKSGYIRADETEVRYLDRQAPGGSSRGRFWVYKGLNGDVLFDWQLTREHHHLTDWLGRDYEGVLGSDGYEAYQSYCVAQALRGKSVERAACHAHIRRKYETALDQNPGLAAWFLKIYGQLYQIETTLREIQADARAKERYRRRHSLPLLRLLDRANKHLLTKTRILPKSRLGQAIRYALGQWGGALTYIENGHVEIDNNGVERDIRPSAVGKKNWLFVGSPEAGDRSVVLYSLLISARHHGVDPESYLRDVLKRLPGCSTDPAALRELLPENWAAAHKADQAPGGESAAA
ncbi:MAG: IS66 family transposase [Verrucomicrobia bacterium]|nr:IS66 family transposase [Verrucomicrobiota bacterium]